MSFYRSITLQIESIPLIIYLEKGIENILGTELEQYKNYLNNLYNKNTQILKKGSYHILILWNENEDVMVDVWIYSDLKEWTNTPIVDVANFKNIIRYTDDGITAGYGLILLGEEEKKRKLTKNLQDYLSDRNLIISDIVLNQNILKG